MKPNKSRVASERPLDLIVRGWQPIATAPKDGRLIIVGNAYGVWVAAYCPIAGSGFTFDNPWRSMMLNHDHLWKIKGVNIVPNFWMPLPEAPNMRVDVSSGLTNKEPTT